MRILVLILVSAVVAACGDAVRVVKQTIALQEAFFRQIDKRSPTPEIRDRLRALARAGAGDSVQLLVTHGLVRLNDSTLIRRMELMSVMLEGSEESVCAALSRGNPGSGQMTLAMTELEDPHSRIGPPSSFRPRTRATTALPPATVTTKASANTFR